MAAGGARAAGRGAEVGAGRPVLLDVPGRALPLAFWARRQAHETAVHRVDAESALGAPLSR